MGVWTRPDEEWERWARRDPYFAVLTDDRFRAKRRTAADDRAFWESGDAYVRRVVELVETRLGVRVSRGGTLDFGCGVGRLLVPLARRSRCVLGLDVSPTMLALAAESCRRFGVTNVRLDVRPAADDRFDFVHSALVFQHIAVPAGLRALRNLLDAVRPGGVTAVQFLVSRPEGTFLRRAARRVRGRIGPVNALFNLAGGRSAATPYMEMNAYPEAVVRAQFEAAGFGTVHVVHETDGEFRFGLFLARKSAGGSGRPQGSGSLRP